MTSGRLGAYEIVGRIGAGGMAEVLLGRRAGPGGFTKPVAIKRLLPEVARDEELRAMFVEEARLQAGLSHGNLVQVFDFGEDGGERFLVMEYVEGTDLAALLGREGRLAPALALHIAAAVAEGLDYLHARGIVHRDVSPGNVYLSRAGEVKLGDFGIAKGRAAALRTERGRLKGKLLYLAPEQARGEVVDARTDLYALGLVLFEMLSGQRYLAGEAEVDVLRAAMDPQSRSSGVAGAPETVVAWLLRPHREERPASARFAAEAIRQAIAEIGVAPGPAGLAALVEGVASLQARGAPSAAGTERLSGRARSSTRVAVIGTATVALAVALWLALGDGGRSSEPPRSSVAPPQSIPVPSFEPEPSLVRSQAAPAPPSADVNPVARSRPRARHESPRPLPTDVAPAPPIPATGPPPPITPPPAPRVAPDRAAIERRLATLGPQLQRASLDEEKRHRARRLAQQALDSAIERRFVEAERTLDDLEALLATDKPP